MATTTDPLRVAIGLAPVRGSPRRATCDACDHVARRRRDVIRHRHDCDQRAIDSHRDARRHALAASAARLRPRCRTPGSGEGLKLEPTPWFRQGHAIDPRRYYANVRWPAAARTARLPPPRPRLERAAPDAPGRSVPRWPRSSAPTRPPPGSSPRPSRRRLRDAGRHAPGQQPRPRPRQPPPRASSTKRPSSSSSSSARQTGSPTARPVPDRAAAAPPSTSRSPTRSSASSSASSRAT